MMIALIALASAYLLVLAGKIALAWRYARRCPAPSRRAAFADVTILQPVLGGDPALFETLRANLAQLPGAQFIWLLDHDDRAGWETCRAVAAKSPAARIQLVGTPPVPPSANPKIFKLARGEALVATAFTAVLDDDTRLTGDGLSALIDALADHDVSTGLPLYLPGSNAPTRLLAQFVNNQSILTYLPPLVFSDAITLNGMCYALATARLRALGGFAPLTHRLTDDLAMARLVRASGGRIFQSVIPLAVTTTVADWKSYLRQMHRWMLFATLQLRAQSFVWRVAIALLHGVPPLLLWATLGLAVVVTIGRGDWIAGGVVVAFLECRSVMIASTHRVLGARVSHALHARVWSLVSELLQPFHLLHALLWRRIRWRRRVIDVRSDESFFYAE
jgi:ceramide glucosyltransferase